MKTSGRKSAQLKSESGKIIIKDFHSAEAAHKAEEEFTSRGLSKRKFPMKSKKQILRPAHTISPTFAANKSRFVEKRSEKIDRTRRRKNKRRKGFRYECGNRIKRRNFIASRQAKIFESKINLNGTGNYRNRRNFDYRNAGARAVGVCARVYRQSFYRGGD